ncbi:membrane protein [Streptomyces echinoruber]|uniref:Membrane protein n=1 Tax=Streptomyces echinoruber TaxID=68898 RepID=A0A918RDP5_9ACTN|nr:membrane protein [Streptomyces echinoruber]
MGGEDRLTAASAPLDRVLCVSGFVRNVRLWFAPEEVRGEGSTPDYRFSLANERTFLAWLRTALALIGGGFAVDQFLPDLGRGWRVGLALALLAAGVLCALRAVNHWVRCERAMRRGEDLPVSRFPAVLSLVVAVVAVAMVAVVLLGWEG